VQIEDEALSIFAGFCLLRPFFPLLFLRRRFFCGVGITAIVYFGADGLWLNNPMEINRCVWSGRQFKGIAEFTGTRGTKFIWACTVGVIGMLVVLDGSVGDINGVGVGGLQLVKAEFPRVVVPSFNTFPSKGTVPCGDRACWNDDNG